jgi:hypothetical protein
MTRANVGDRVRIKELSRHSDAGEEGIVEDVFERGMAGVYAEVALDFGAKTTVRIADLEVLPKKCDK